MSPQNWTIEKIYEKLKTEEISTKYQFKKKRKVYNLSLGRIWFNLFLPDDYKVIDEIVGKNDLDNLIKDLIEKYDPDKISKIISKLQKESFHLSSLNPMTFDIDTFILSDKTKNELDNFQKNADKLSDKDFIKKADEITDKMMIDLKDKKSGLYDLMMSNSSGKVSKDTWRILNVTKGLTTNISGDINRITAPANSGFNIKDYYKNAAESRMNLFLKTIAVRNPGYLARKIVMSNAGLKIDQTDCKSKKYLEIFIEAKQAKSFIGRYFLNSKNELQLIKNPKQIINKKIKLRSPIFCLSKKGICSVCYGQLSEKLNSSNIGILAGGAINNEVVNAMMKARHKSSNVEFIDVDFIKNIKESNINQHLVNLYLDVQKNTIIAKKNITIYIDFNEYNENHDFINFGNKYQIPGILNFYASINNIFENIFITPFNFFVNLYLPENISNNGKKTYLNFSPGELILKKDKYINSTNPTIISKLLDGTTKYIKDPVILLNLLSHELPKTDSSYLELIVSNMFRSKENQKIPGRLVNYKNIELIGVKKLPFINSWLSGIAFENINKSIKTALINQDDAEMNPFDEILMGEIYKPNET